MLILQKRKWRPGNLSDVSKDVWNDQQNINFKKSIAAIYSRSVEDFGMSYISEEVTLWMLVQDYIPRPSFPFPNCNKMQYLCVHTGEVTSVSTDVTKLL